jgi:cytochrome P450
MNNQQDEKYWENPKEFRPDRFLPDGEYFTSEKLGLLRQYLYSPFGIGNRACIGKRFAEIEGVITLAMLLQRYNITLKDPKWEMEISIAVTMRPKASPPIVFEKR